MPTPSTPNSTLLGETFTFTSPFSEASIPVPPFLWQRVDEWEALIEQQLQRQLSGEAPSAWDDLVAACGSLENIHEQSREKIDQLLAAGRMSTAAARAYGETHLAAAVAEARVQALLGTLTSTELAAITACLQPLIEGQEAPQAYLLGGIALADGEQRETWPGAFTVTTLTALTTFTEAPRVLLYRFGAQGGWSAHATSRDLLEALAGALAAALPQRVIMTHSFGRAIDSALRAQLKALQALRGTLLTQNAESRERALIEALDTLATPLNPPRALALVRVEERHRSLSLARKADTWLSSVPEQVRSTLSTLITDCTSALVASEQLLRRDLPTREHYVRQRVRERLVNDFGLTAPCRVRLKLPAYVESATQLIGESGAPGTPLRRVPRPSRQTETLPLEQLALEQPDEAMEDRLQFLEVEVTPSYHPQAQDLKAGITLAWLRQTLPALDAAGGYERLLADVHLRAGKFDEQGDQVGVLRRPYELMLEIQAHLARHNGGLDALGLRMVQVASNAATPDAWKPDTLDLVMRPVAMTLFDPDTQSGGSTLGGVVLLQERQSDTTVLYLPQAPNGRGLSQYSSLRVAIEALQTMFIDERMRRYLCERALEGDPRWLESQVNQGLVRGFRKLVEPRDPWPSNQSLAANQFLAELGLSITAHRRSSTSNADRVFSDALASREHAVRWIRFAIGFVPVLGSVVALVDAIEAGIAAGHAFAEGDSVRGIEAVQSVLMCLVDVLFDFAPAGLAASASSASLVATTKARQLRQGLQGAGRLRRLAGWNARRADEAFAGYEASVTLTSRPGTEGKWRGVYQEPEGNYIARGSGAYAVEWDDAYHTWRLAGTRIRSYRQPIALDESGHWQTHGQLYGSLIDGGLQGGGGAQSYLADRLDPVWPDALRRLLPRWWTDAHFRRQQRLTSERHARMTTYAEEDRALYQARDTYRANRGTADSARHGKAVVEASDRVIASATSLYETLEEIRALTRGRRYAESGLDQSRSAATICSRSHLQIEVAYVESERLADLALAQRDELNELIATLREAQTLTAADIAQVVDQAKVIRETLSKVFDHYNQIDSSMERVQQWQRRVTSAEHRSQLQPDTERFQQMFSQRRVILLRTGLLLDLAPNNNLRFASWRDMRRLYTPPRERFDRAAQSLLGADAINLRPEQRQRLQRQFHDCSQALLRTVRRLTLSYPEQFEGVYAERLLDELQRAHDHAHVSPIQPPRAPGRSRPRTFEADGLLLIGEPVDGKRNVLAIGKVDNRREFWQQTKAGDWAPVDPPARPTAPPLAELARHAEARLGELTAIRERFQRFARRPTQAADLEDLYVGESQDLQWHAERLRSADSEHRHDALLERLRAQADALRDEGRRVRIAHCKASTKPTGGQLEYLYNAGVIDIRKVGDLQPSGTTLRTRDWLQEYEIVDRESDAVLSYAHFHYSKAQPRFADFEAAHLKSPGQRYLSATDAGEPAIWRGEISRQLAQRLFEPLFR